MSELSRKLRVTVGCMRDGALMPCGAVYHEMLHAADELDRLQAELREGDYWQQRARQSLENGVCPLCFATDEAGHNENCPWGFDERELDRLQALLSTCPTWLCPECRNQWEIRDAGEKARTA